MTGVSSRVKVAILQDENECVKVREDERRVLASIARLGVDIFSVFDPQQQLRTSMHFLLASSDDVSRWLRLSDCFPAVLLPQQPIVPADAAFLRELILTRLNSKS